MRKQDFINIYSDMGPDEFMKQKIEIEVLNIENRKSPKRTSSRKAAVFAVSLAVIVCIGVSLPVMAEYIPTVRNALNSFLGKDFYDKDPVLKNDAIGDLAETLDVTGADKENNISLNIQNVYYDGDDVLIYYAFETYGDKYKDYTSVSSEDFVLYADGKEVVFPEEYFNQGIRIISGGRENDPGGVYNGTVRFTGAVLPDKDTLDMELKINSVELLDTRKLYFNYDAENPAYDYGTPDTYETDISCGFEMHRLNNLGKTYLIGQEKEGITLNSVTITPLKTVFDIKNEHRDRLAYSLTDNMGNKIEFISGKDTFDTPLKSAKSLTLECMDMSEESLPEICSFTFDIDGGYRNEDLFNDQTYETGLGLKDKIFIPSEEEADKWIASHKGIE